MTTLRVHHRTRYLYERPVAFGQHRLMLRPRDGHDMRILDSALRISPRAEVRWEFDTFGNSVAFANFLEKAKELVIESDLLLRRYALDEPGTGERPRGAPFPFAYDADELIDLAPLLATEREVDTAAVRDWLSTALPIPADTSLAVLRELTAAIHQGFAYRRREEPGVQSPGQTLALREGACRDFAFLFMEAARQMGFAARFATGYLYDPATDRAGGSLKGGGATHAWAEVFVHGAGWIEFDPTNRLIAGRNLVRVATTRSPTQALPIQGTYRHDGVSCLSMDVTVTLTEVSPDASLSAWGPASVPSPAKDFRTSATARPVKAAAPASRPAPWSTPSA